MLKKAWNLFWLFVEKAYKNKLTTLIFLVGGYLAIFQTPLDAYLYTLIFPEPPIIIVKSHIENIEFDSHYISNFIDNSNKFSMIPTLYDACGNFFLITYLLPTGIPELSKNIAFLRTGQENLTYSISIIKDKQLGTILLHIYSYDTKFSIQKKVAAVEEIGESINIEWLTEKIYNINLANIQKYQALFDIIPLKDGKIIIDCTGIKNCKVVDTI